MDSPWMTIAFVIALPLYQATAPTTAPAARDAFPNTWIGSYRGPCTYVTPGGRTQHLQMEMQIAATADPTRYQWTIVYVEQGQRQVRPYELQVIDAVAGKFLIDEKNSIRIDSYYIDGALYGEFEVGQVRVTASYRMLDGKLLVELITIDPRRPTNTGGQDAPQVTTYPVRGVQRATLSPVRG